MRLKGLCQHQSFRNTDDVMVRSKSSVIGVSCFGDRFYCCNQAEQKQTRASLTPLCEPTLQHNNEKLMYCTGSRHTVGILPPMKCVGQTYTSDLRPLDNAGGATAPLSTEVKRANGATQVINAIHDAVARWGGGRV